MAHLLIIEGAGTDYSGGRTVLYAFLDSTYNLAATVDNISVSTGSTTVLTISDLNTSNSRSNLVTGAEESGGVIPDLPSDFVGGKYNLKLTGTTWSFEIRTAYAELIEEFSDSFIKVNTAGSSSGSGGLTVESGSDDAKIYFTHSDNKWKKGVGSNNYEIVGKTEIQTLTNKTISTANNTITRASTGDLGVASFSNSNFSVSNGAVSIKNDGIALGTHTTGNYIKNITASTGLTGDTDSEGGQATLAIDNTVVTLTGTQTLTNKTLTSPTVSGLYLSDSSIVFEGSSNEHETTLSVVEPTSDKTISLPTPNANDTVTLLAETQTLTNKTLTSPVISGGTIDNSVIGGTTPAAGTFTTGTFTSGSFTTSITVGSSSLTLDSNSITVSNDNTVSNRNLQLIPGDQVDGTLNTPFCVGHVEIINSGYGLRIGADQYFNSGSYGVYGTSTISNGDKNKVASIVTPSYNQNGSVKDNALLYSVAESSTTEIFYGGLPSGTTHAYPATKHVFMTGTASTLSDPTPTEQMKITSSEVLVSTKFHVDTGEGELTFHNDASGGNGNLRIWRNDTTIASGNPIGYLSFAGSDATTSPTDHATIYADTAGDHSNGDNPTNLKFQTTPDGSATPADRMTIYHDGKVGIGNTSPDGLLDISTQGAVSNDVYIQSNTGSHRRIIFKDNHTTPTKYNFQIAVQEVDQSLHIGPSSAVGNLIFSGLKGLVIDSDGNLGIGTDAPVSCLEVKGNSNGDTKLGHFWNNHGGTLAESTVYVTNSSVLNTGLFLQQLGTGFTTTGGFVQNGSTIGSGTGASGGLSIMTRANADIRFYTNGHANANQRMIIKSSGNVGIGTSTPGSVLPLDSDTTNLLEIKSRTDNKDSGIRVVRKGDNTVGFDLWVCGGATSHDTYFDNRYELSDWIFRSGTRGSGTCDEVMRVTGEGNVGIGTNSPDHLFEIESASPVLSVNATGNTDPKISLKDSGTMKWDIYSDDSDSDKLFISDDDLTRRLTIQQDGKVGIGTASPNSRLSASLCNTSTSTLSTSSLAALQVSNPNNTTSNYSLINFSFPDNDINALIGSQLANSTNGTADLVFGTRTAASLTEKVRIKSDGNVGIGTHTPEAKLDIQSGNIALVMGADNEAATLTNSTVKTARMGVHHYDNAEEPTTVFVVDSESTTNTIYIGGGTNHMNATSFIKFFTAANGTTPSGTQRMVITEDGEVGIGVDDPSVELEVSGVIKGTGITIGTSTSISSVDTDLSSVSGSDDTLASAKSIKAYVDDQVTAQDLDFQGDSGGALNIDLDSEALTFTGGSAITTTGSGNTITIDLSVDDSTVEVVSDTLKVKDSGITTAKIADANVTTDKIADANVTTVKIADANVTTDKIADANVTTAKIADSNVTTDKIADSNVTNAKLSSSSITVTAGGGLSTGGSVSLGSSVTLDHADTSSQASVDNSGSTVIQDITLDTYGHVTSLGSVQVTSTLAGATDTNINTPSSAHILVYDGSDSWDNKAISGDITINSSGVASIQADSVTLGTDTTGNYVSTITGGNGVSSTGTTTGENISHTLSVDTKANGGLAFESNKLALDLGASTITGTLSVSDGGTGSTDASGARSALGVDASGTDNSTNVTLVTTSHDYLSISGQAITLGTIDVSDDTNLTAGTGITLSGDTLSVNASEVDHDSLSNFVANEHIDWTTSSAGTIHSSNVPTVSTVTVTDNDDNSNYDVTFTNGSNALLEDDGQFYYNPSTGTLRVPNLTVQGTTTTVDSVQMQAQNAIVFEGATADEYETTLTITDPTADRTFTLPDATGTVITTGNLSDITTVGTISSGTWQGTAITDAYISSQASWNAKLDTAGTGLTKSGTTINLDSSLSLSSLTVSGSTALNGGITVDTNAFIVADSTGTVTSTGNLNFSGTGNSNIVGKLGVGLTSAAMTGSTLEIGTGALRVKNASIDSQGFNISQESSNISRIHNAFDDGVITFGNKATHCERMRLDSSGQLGIGTSPATTLHIKSANPVIKLEDSDPDTVYGQIDGAGGTLILIADGGGSAASSAIKFRIDGGTASSDKMVVLDSGNVGIGTSTPGAVLPLDSDTTNLLEIQSRAANKDSGLRIVRFADDVVGFDLWVDGGASTHDTYFDNRYEASDWIFRSGTRGSGTCDEVMRVTGEGNVGIGTSPAEKLHVDGAIRLGTTSNSVAGNLRWTGSQFQGYSGSEWLNLGAGGGSGTPTINSGVAKSLAYYESAGNQLSDTETTSGDGVYWDSTNDRLGIGTSTPSSTLDVNGHLSATTKSFDIKHPSKEGKRLIHGSLEGPEHGVYIRGRTNGEKEVELPDYWIDLVDLDTITVQLTAVGNKQNIWVSSINNNRIIIGSDMGFVDCFYFIQAERKDVDKLQIEVEEVSSNG